MRAQNMSSEQCDDKEQASGDDEDEANNVLDPRVKGELDRLNSSTAEINRLEKELEEVQETFRQTLSESAIVLKSESSFLGKKCVEQARPYYNAVQKAKETQMEIQKVALKYERACSAHQSAREVMARAENKFVSTATEHKILDSSWQEMLNQAILKVMESEEEKRKCEKDHLEIAHAFTKAEKHVAELKVKLKSPISRSRSYFELKDTYMEVLQTHKHRVEVLQESIQKAKKEYSLALKSLEEISDEIHEMRKSRDNLDTLLNEREEGVGAESPVSDNPHDVTRDDKKDCTINGVFGFKIAIIRTKYPPKMSGRQEFGEGSEYPCQDMMQVHSHVDGVQAVNIQENSEVAGGDSPQMEGCWSNMRPARLGVAGGAPEVEEFRREVEGACLEVGEASETVEGAKLVVVGSSSVVGGTWGGMGEAALEVDVAKGEVDVAKGEVDVAKVEVDGAKVEVDGAKVEVDGAKVEVDGAKVEVDGAKVEVDEAKVGVDEATPEKDGAKVEVDGAKVEADEAKVEVDEATPEKDGATPDMDGAKLEVDGAALELDEAKVEVDDANPGMDRTLEVRETEVVC